VLTRQDWGADESLMNWPPEYQRVQKAIVHHTAGDDGGTNVAATIRAIYYFHAVTRGWGDIGYNYLVDKFGNIWTGRAGGDHVIGGHAYGWNNGSFGVAAIGTYSVTSPTPAMVGAIANIIAMKFAQFGIAPYGADAFTHQEQRSDGTWIPVTSSPPNVQGHRDANYIVGQKGGQTECPGGALYAQLPTIRSLAQAAVQNGYLNLRRARAEPAQGRASGLGRAGPDDGAQPRNEPDPCGDRALVQDPPEGRPVREPGWPRHDRRGDPAGRDRDGDRSVHRAGHRELHGPLGSRRPGPRGGTPCTTTRSAT